MTNSASKKPDKAKQATSKQKFIAVFLLVQAFCLLGLVTYNYYAISLGFLCAALVWAFISLWLGIRQVYFTFFNFTPQNKDYQPNSTDDNILGEPGQNLNLARLFSLIEEGAALLKDGKIIFANQSLTYLLAAHEDELTGTGISAYIHPDDAGLINMHPADGQHQGISRSTLRLTTKLGDVRWVICSAHHVSWEGADAVLLLIENIAALKESQKAQEELQHQSRLFLERSPLGVAMFDAMGQLKISNTAWHSMWSNIVGNSGRRFNILQDHFLPNTAVERAIRQAFGKKTSGVSNFEHSTPWGETRWLNLNFHPMTDHMGKLVGVGMIQQDITDQVRSLRRENELNDQLTALKHEIFHCGSIIKHLQNNLGYISLSFDKEGLITSWNPAAEKRFKFSAKDVIGRHYKQLGDHFALYAPIIQKTLNGNIPPKPQQITRLDNSASVQEEVTVTSLEIGMKNHFMLEIKNIPSA